MVQQHHAVAKVFAFNFLLRCDKDRRVAVDRAGSGVRAFRIYRPVGDDYVMIELDFETQEAAVMFLARLEEEVWTSGPVAPALLGTPETRIVEVVENTTVAW